jgi:hypothetical protein
MNSARLEGVSISELKKEKARLLEKLGEPSESRRMDVPDAVETLVLISTELDNRTGKGAIQLSLRKEFTKQVRPRHWLHITWYLHHSTEDEANICQTDGNGNSLEGSSSAMMPWKELFANYEVDK